MQPQASNEIVVETDENEGYSNEIISIKETTVGDNASKALIVDPVVNSLFTDEYGIAKFLSRPTLIATRVFGLGAPFTIDTYAPWRLFFDNATIKKKVDNYAFVQCSLHIKVVVKASPFIYGNFAITYQPQISMSNHAKLTAADQAYRIPLSQRMGITVEPHKNKGGEMVLPFFHHKNWLELTVASELDQMGEIQVWPYASLQSANGGGSNGVTFNIYAWAEDVVLAGPTNTLVAQSETTTEYGQGPVSRVASTVADVSSSLEDMPVIGLFAKATTIGARAISGIASLFGFTKVPVIEDAKPFRATPFHGFASSEIGVPLDKLTIDPKNELSVDPRTVGLEPVDELSINHIAKRESIIAIHDWLQSEGKGDYIFSANVGPTMHDYTAITGGHSLRMTPMHMAATMFSNWRGEIVYTIKIVRSVYHQGSLQICYDPVGNPFNNNDNSSTLQTKIVDIADSDEIEFRIPWTQAQSFLRVDPNFATTTSRGTSTTTNVAVTGYDTDYHNGRFVVKVFNALSAPDATSNVRLLFFVRCENMVLANPSELSTAISDFAPQSSTTIETTKKEDARVSYTMGTTVPVPEHVFDVNFGEVYYSLRPILRRTCRIMSEPITPGVMIDQVAFRYRLTKYPPAYGYDPNGRFAGNNQAATLSVPFNYCLNVPQTILAPCFVGQRGSVDWHMNLNGLVPGENFYAQRKNDYTGTHVRFSSQMPTSNDGEKPMWFMNQFDSGLTGMSLVNRKTQTSLQVSFPQFNKFRFVSTDPNYYVHGRTYDDTENEKMEVGFNVDDADGQGPRSTLDFYSNVGVDYTLFYFLNVPVRYLYTTPSPNGNALTWG